jgi:hypothetical protein
MWPHERPEAHFTSHRLLLEKQRLLVADENFAVDFVDMALLYMLQSHSKALENLFGPLYLLSTLLVISGIVTTSIE